MTPVTWKLWLGDQLIATIVADDYEFPWTYGRLVDSPEFDRFRVYFGPDDEWPESADFDALLSEMRTKGLRLQNTATGEMYSRFTLNQEGQTVWFRWSG